MKAGDRVMIGAEAMCKRHVGWQLNGERTTPEGVNVADWFRDDVYLGPDTNGLEPVFRDLTPAETEEFIAQEADMCPICGIGYYLPSGVCDHCNVRRLA